MHDWIKLTWDNQNKRQENMQNEQKNNKNGAFEQKDIQEEVKQTCI